MAPKSFSKDPQNAWTWILFAGTLVLILVVLAITTYHQLDRGKILMQQALTHQADMKVRSLEGAVRANMRGGMWRELLLQTLVEEMAENPDLRSLAILDPQGQPIALGSKSDDRGWDRNPLAGLKKAQIELVNRREPMEAFTGKELVVGRPFDPFRHYRTRGRPLPEWAQPVTEGHDSEHPPVEPPDPRQMHGRMMGRMMRQMMSGPPPPPGKPPAAYAILHMSIDDFLIARRQALGRALLLAGLVFVGAGVVAWALWVAARRRNREVDRLRREVAQAQHLAAVGRLAGSVAHEIRNPLSALRGLVQYLAKGYEADSKEALYAAGAVEEVDRLERVVSGLLDYTRDQKPRRFPLDVGEAIQAAVDFMSDDPRASEVDITVEVEGELPQIQADPDQLRQVLLNLVVNSLEALDGRGRLVVSARPAKDAVTVEVADDGPGLPPGDSAQVFDPFFSTRERGTGLGLAIARRMVEAHGGDLTAGRSEMGGASFRFTLPVGGNKA